MVAFQYIRCCFKGDSNACGTRNMGSVNRCRPSIGIHIYERTQGLERQRIYTTVEDTARYAHEFGNNVLGPLTIIVITAKHGILCIITTVLSEIKFLIKEGGIGIFLHGERTDASVLLTRTLCSCVPCDLHGVFRTHMNLCTYKAFAETHTIRPNGSILQSRN
jgi:hypothetical protein